MLLTFHFVTPRLTSSRTSASSACCISARSCAPPQDRRLPKSGRALHAGDVLPDGSILMDAPTTTDFEELTELAKHVHVSDWRQMWAAAFPTLGKSRGGGAVSADSPADPSTALNPNPNACLHSPRHHSHDDDSNSHGLDVQDPGAGADGDGDVDPTKHEEMLVPQDLPPRTRLWLDGRQALTTRSLANTLSLSTLTL